MTRRKSIAATTAILALSAARCDGQTITHEADDRGKHRDSRRRVSRGIRKTRDANYVGIADGDTASRWRSRQKTRQNQYGHQRKPLSNDRQFESNYQSDSTMIDNITQTLRLTEVVERGKSGKSSLKGKSHKSPKVASLEPSEKYHQQRPPQEQEYQQQQQQQQQYPLQQQQQQQLINGPSSLSDIITSTDENNEYDDFIFAWGQDDVIAPIAHGTTGATTVAVVDGIHVSQAGNISIIDISQLDDSQVSVDSSQANVSQVDSSQVNVSQVDISQVNMSQVNASQVDASQGISSQVNTSEVDPSQHGLLSPQELILLQYENMAEDAGIDDDDDTGMFQWMEDDSAWINDGYNDDDDDDDDDQSNDDVHHQSDVVTLPPPSLGKASKLFKDGIHGGKSGKDSKTGSSSGDDNGGDNIWGGGHSGKPSHIPTWDGGNSAKPSPQPAWGGGHSAKPSPQPAWGGGHSGKPSPQPAWGGGHSGKPSPKPTLDGGKSGKPSSKPTLNYGSSRKPSLKPTLGGGNSGQPSPKPTLGGGNSGQPSLKPTSEGGHSGTPSPKPTWGGGYSGKPSRKPSWGGGHSSKPSPKPTWGGSPSPPSSMNPTTEYYPSLKPVGTSSEPSNMIPSSSPTELAGQLPTTPQPISSSAGPTPLSPTMNPITSIMTPPTSSPSQHDNLPYLTWRGIDTCSFFYPCPVCTGDCDVDSDCQIGLECFKRGTGESTMVPGCRAGGDGDIPGADYCYDPRNNVTPTLMPSGDGDGDNGGGGSTMSPTTKGSKLPVYTFPPSIETVLSQAPTSASGEILPPLSFLGVNGCSVISPCDTCKGDCDSDQECLESLKCYKRADGMKNQVPGCAVGGKGDIAGADYCYDENWSGGVTPSPSTAGGVPIPTMPPLIAFPSMSPINLLAPTSSPITNTSKTDSPEASTSSVPSISVTIPPQSLAPSTVIMPPESETPSIRSTPPQSNAPTIIRKAYFIRSRSRTITKDRELRDDWCASGALSPDYYQLMLGACTADTVNGESTPIRRIEQMDQLWTMDDLGLIHSIYDFSRCMMVQPSAGVLDEASVEIGPCNPKSPLQKFQYDKSKLMLKLIGDRLSPFCVTFLGEAANRGSPLVMEACETKEKFAWDFILEEMYGGPSPSPTATFPPLKYNGRDACNADSPCEICAGDCDGDDGCEAGLRCFQRAKDETTQVPGCKAGGVQDIPGADYCFDPSSPLPPLMWLGSGKKGCTSSKPCNRCVGACVKDTDCKGNLTCFKREEGETKLVPGCRGGGEDDIPGGDYCYDPHASVQPTIEPSRLPTSLIPLRWKGSDGCSPENPCQICTGDCDDDNDCEPPFMCFKRYAGDRNQVPGCQVGGLGDIPGGDYCYDPHLSTGEMPTYSPTEQVLVPSGSD